MIAKQDNHRENDGVDREGLTGMTRREAGTKLMIMATSILWNPQMAMATSTSSFPVILQTIIKCEETIYGDPRLWAEVRY
jgi:hypothetical protein